MYNWGERSSVCCKQDSMSDSKNRKINEGIIDPSVNKYQVITMSTPGVDDVSILSKQSETSITVTPKQLFLYNQP